MIGTGRGRFREGAFRGEHGARRYRLYVPPGVSDEPTLVVMLHGCTQDAEDFAAGTGMNALADEAGFLVLYPEQPVEAHPKRCWRWYEPEHQRRGGGEPAILTSLVRQVVATWSVPTGHAHLAGISAGGAMALVVASTYPEVYGSVASHSGIPYASADGPDASLVAMTGGGPDVSLLTNRLREASGERTGSLPPLIVFQGTADEAVHPRNAEKIVLAWLGALGDGAGDEPDDTVRGESGGGRAWIRRTWRAGSGDPRVEQWIVEGLGHAWSGGHAAGSYADPRGPDATRAILRFAREVSGGTGQGTGA